MGHRAIIIAVVGVICSLIAPQSAMSWEFSEVEINGVLFAGVGMYSPEGNSETRLIGMDFVNATQAWSSGNTAAYASSGSYITIVGDSLYVGFSCRASAQLSIFMGAANASMIYLAFKAEREAEDSLLSSATVTWESKCEWGGAGTGSAQSSISGTMNLFGVETVNVSNELYQPVKQGTILVTGVSDGMEFRLGTPNQPAHLESRAQVNDLNLLGDRSSLARLSVGIKLVDYSQVEVERSSWGKIKLLYSE